MEGWIKVTDRLPKDEWPHYETSPDVLVYSSRGYVIGRQFVCGEWCDSHLYGIAGVTHWKKLHKPPED